jgi:hypothetical protein
MSRNVIFVPKIYSVPSGLLSYIKALSFTSRWLHSAMLRKVTCHPICSDFSANVSHILRKRDRTVLETELCTQ